MTTGKPKQKARLPASAVFRLLKEKCDEDPAGTQVVFRLLKEKCDEDPAGTQVLEVVDNAIYYAFQRTKSIIRHMGEFTLHDGDHLFRVLSMMERLLSDEQLQTLNIPELMLLILTSFFHDIGMAADEKDVIAWKKGLGCCAGI